jgi:hypothetical protein
MGFLDLPVRLSRHGKYIVYVFSLGALSDIALSPTTRANIRIQNVRIKFWSLLWRFIKAPSQSKLVCVVIPSIEIEFTRTKPTSTSPSLSPFPTDDVLLAISSLKYPSHPFWRDTLPRIHRFSLLARVIHLIGINFASISVVFYQAGKAFVSINVCGIYILLAVDTYINVACKYIGTCSYEHVWPSR